MSTTILADEQIDATLASLDCLFWDVSEGATHDFARAIEQAVPQSPEVQALRKDAERYRWLKERNSGPIGIVAWHCDGEKEMVLMDSHADETISTAMEKQP